MLGILQQELYLDILGKTLHLEIDAHLASGYTPVQCRGLMGPIGIGVIVVYAGIIDTAECLIEFYTVELEVQSLLGLDVLDVVTLRQ